MHRTAAVIYWPIVAHFWNLFTTAEQYAIVNFFVPWAPVASTARFAAVVRKDAQLSEAWSALLETHFRICVGTLATVRPKTNLDPIIFIVTQSMMLWKGNTPIPIDHARSELSARGY